MAIKIDDFYSKDDVKALRQRLQGIYGKIREQSPKRQITLYLADGSSVSKAAMDMSMNEFDTSLIIEYIYGKPPGDTPIQPTERNWIEFINNKLEELKIPPTTAEIRNPWEASTRSVPWYTQREAYVSENGKNYVVPISYKLKPETDEKLQPYLDQDGKLSVTSDTNGALVVPESRQSIKKDALVALLSHLNKQEMIPSDLEKFASFGSIDNSAESFYVEPRPRKRIFFRVLFDRAWVTTLPNAPTSDQSIKDATKKVTIQAKDLLEGTFLLEKLIQEFGQDILDGGWLVRGYASGDGVPGSCEIPNITLVPPWISDLLVKNNKKPLGPDNTDYIQFGFTSTYDLVYIAHTDDLDCLCDSEGVAANLLKLGFDTLKTHLPFTSQRTNAFINFLPKIMTKYSPFMKESGNRRRLMKSSFPWTEFVNSYVYPTPKIVGQNKEAAGSALGREISELLNPLTEPLYDLGLGLGRMGEASPIKSALVALANSETEFIGDTNLNQAFASVSVVKRAIEQGDWDPVYDLVLNKISIDELTRLAVQTLMSCVGLGNLEVAICRDLLEDAKIDVLEKHIMPCLIQSGHGDVAQQIVDEVQQQTINLVNLAWESSTTPLERFRNENPALYQARLQQAQGAITEATAARDNAITAYNAASTEYNTAFEVLSLYTEEPAPEDGNYASWEAAKSNVEAAKEKMNQAESASLAAQADLTEIMNTLPIDAAESKKTDEIVDAIIPPIPTGKNIYLTKPQPVPGPTMDQLAELNKLYCSNSNFKELAGNPNDIMKNTLENFLDDVRVCRCIIDQLGSAVDALLELKDVGGDIEDYIEEVGNMTSGLFKDALTLPINYTIETTDFISDIEESFYESLKQIGISMLGFLVLELLEYVRDSIRGSLGTDLCGSDAGALDPFTYVPLSQLMKESYNTARDERDACLIAQDIFNEWGVNTTGPDSWAAGALGEEWTDRPGAGDRVCGFLDGLAETLTISEFRRMLKEPCQPGMDGQKQDLIGKVSDYAKEKFPEFVSDPEVLPYHPGLENSAVVAGIMGALGTFVDDTVIDKQINKFNDLKNQVVDYCKDNTEGICVHLADALSGEDCKKQIKKDQDDILDDFGKWMNLVDPKKMEKLIPPLFCGPCSPAQADLAPVVQSQTHPTQDYLNDVANSEIYKAINFSLNDDLRRYKPILLETNNLINQVSRVEGTDGSLKRSPITDIIQIASFPSEILDGLDDDIKNAVTDKVSALQTALEENLKGIIDADFQFAGNKVRAAILESIGDEEVNIVTGYPDLEVFIFSTDPYEFYLIFNFNDSSKEGPASTSVDPSSMMMLIVNNGTAFYSKTLLDYKSIQNNFSGEVTKMFRENYNTYFSSLSSEDVSSLYESVDSYQGSLVALITEKLLRSSVEEGLFVRAEFDKLPLNDEDGTFETVADPCAEEREPDSGLLNLGEIKSKTSIYAKQLECVIPRNATPSAVEAANLMGFYEILIKTIVLEQFLKNIFALTAFDISDIVRSETYMDTMVEDVHQAFQSQASKNETSFSDFKKNVLNIIDFRVRTGEDIPNINSEDDAVKYLIGEVCLEMAQVLKGKAFGEGQGVLLFDENPAGDAKFNADFIGNFLDYLLESPEPREVPAGIILGDEDPAQRGVPQTIAFDDLIDANKVTKPDQPSFGLAIQDYIEIRSKYNVDSDMSLYTIPKSVHTLSDGTYLTIPLKMKEFLEKAGYDSNEEIRDFLLDPNYAFLTRPNPNAGMGTEDYSWDLSKCLEEMSSYKYKGKIALSHLNYYVAAYKDLENTNGSKTFVGQADLFERIKEDDYLDWFEPIKYGQRLMIYLPKDLVTDGTYDKLIKALNPSMIWNSEDLNRGLENKIGHYKRSGGSGETDSIAIPLFEASVELRAPDKFVTVNEMMLGLENPFLEQKAAHVKKELAKQISESMLFQEMIPIREMIVFITLMQRVLMSGKYPQLENLLKVTKNKIIDSIAAQMAAINKDFQQVSNEDIVFNSPLGDLQYVPDIGDLVSQFVKLAVGAAANTIDPTWTTPWFLPGPVTPVGILAKIMNMSGESTIQSNQFPPIAKDACVETPEEDDVIDEPFAEASEVEIPEWQNGPTTIVPHQFHKTFTGLEEDLIVAVPFWLNMDPIVYRLCVLEGRTPSHKSLEPVTENVYAQYWGNEYGSAVQSLFSDFDEYDSLTGIDNRDVASIFAEGMAYYFKYYWTNSTAIGPKPRWQWQSQIDIDPPYVAPSLENGLLGTGGQISTGVHTDWEHWWAVIPVNLRVMCLWDAQWGSIQLLPGQNEDLGYAKGKSCFTWRHAAKGRNNIIRQEWMHLVDPSVGTVSAALAGATSVSNDTYPAHPNYYNGQLLTGLDLDWSWYHRGPVTADWKPPTGMMASE